MMMQSKSHLQVEIIFNLVIFLIIIENNVSNKPLFDQHF